MLLIDDHQTQPPEANIRLDQRVRAHCQVHLAGGEGLFAPGALFCPATAGEQLHAVARSVQHAAQRESMLLGQDFCGRHERYLPAVLDDYQRRQQRHDGLAATHVTLQQTVHGMG